MPRLNLSQRLFLITLVALIPTVVILGYNLVSLRAAEERAMHDQALRVAQLASLEMNQIIRGTEYLLRAIGSAPVVQRSDAAECSDYVASIGRQLPQFVALAVIDRDGLVQCTPFATAGRISVADRSYFLETLRTGRLVVGEYIQGRASNRPSLPIAIPLTGGGAWAGGVVLAAIDLGWLGEQVKGRDLAPQSALTIADRNGRILAREPLPEDFVGTVIPDAFQHLVRAEAPGTLELTSQDGTRRVIGYYPASSPPAGLYVSAGLSTETAFAALNAATLRGVLIVLASLVLAFSLAWSTSRAFIRRPVQQLLATIGQWRREDLTARTGMTDGDGELGEVGKCIDDFLDELLAARASRRTAEAQRELLLGELDHRVKNLVATVQAVARQTFRTSEPGENAEIFLDRLAMMSSAHNLLMGDEWQEATVGELVETTIAPFTGPQAPQFVVAGPKFALNARATLALGMALHELCTNAAKYGALTSSAGRVELTWALSSDPGEGGSFRLTWTERGGPPVSAPRHRGFGSRMIEQALAQQIEGDVRIAFEAEGVVCTVTAPVSVVGSQRSEAA